VGATHPLGTRLNGEGKVFLGTEALIGRYRRGLPTGKVGKSSPHVYAAVKKIKEGVGIEQFARRCTLEKDLQKSKKG